MNRRDGSTDGNRVGSARLLVMSGSAVLSVIAAALVARGNGGVVPFLAWLCSLAAGLALLHRPGPHGRPASGACLDVALITALAGFFRLYRIGEIPNGPWVDELAAAANAVTLAGRHPFTPFGTTPLFEVGPNWVHTPNLYLYACFAVLWLSGFSQVGLKLISVIPGVATPVLLYLLGRRFLSREAALIAGGLLAVSDWHVTVSRWGWDEVLITALTAAMFLALLAGIEEGRLSWFFVAGVVAGLAQYGYVAARLSAAAAAAFLAARAIQDRQRRRLVELGVFGVALVQTVLPMAVYWFGHAATFAVREHEISIVPRLLAGDLRPLLENLRAYGLMLLVRGDANPRQNIPGLPMLDPVAGILFLAGLAAALAAWRRTESQMVLLWLGFGMLGGVLSHPESAPNSYRVGMVAPACMLLAGMGWREALGLLRRVRLGNLARFSAWAAAGAIALSGSLTFVNYFVNRPASRECWLAVKEGAYCEMLRQRVERALDAGAEVLLDRRIEGVTAHLQLDILLARRRPAMAVRWVEPSTLAPSVVSRGMLFVGAPRYPELPRALQALPARAVAGKFGGVVFVAVSADRTLLARVESGLR